jgi:cytoskeletal protein CcmA (bactofilin family)
VGRYDRSTTLTDASGDFITVGNPLPVTSTGGGSGGGTSQADKSTFGEGTGIGTPIMGVVNDALGGLVGEDKAAAVRITPARGLHCNLRDVNGDEIGTAGAPLRIDPTGTTPQPVSGTVTIQDGGGSITIDGTVAATQSGSWTVAATQSGSWSVSITGSVTVASLNTADYDTGVGTVTQAMVGIALPASGGPVAGGTSTNPVRTDPTGATAQPVTDGGGSLTVDGSVSISGSVTVTGTVAATQSGTWNVGLNAGSNTIGIVDQGAGGVSAWKVDGSGVTQPVSGTVSVSGTVTVSGTVAATQSGSWSVSGSGTFTTAQTNAATADYDSGAGTVTQVMFGVALPASGGPVAGGTATNPLRTDPTGTTAQPITDNGGSLTVDGSVSISGSVTVTGTVAATQSGGWTVTANAGTGIFAVQSELQLDYDSGAGSQSLSVFGLALPGNGGAVAGGTATNPVRTDPTGSTAQPVTDNGGSLTVDGSVSISGSVTVTGTVAATQSGTWNVGLSTGTNSIGDVRSVTTSIIPGTSATHLGKAEDAGHASGDTGVFVLAVRNDSRGTLAGTDLDYAPFQLNSSGDLRVDGSGVTQPVSGTVSISGSVTVTGTVAATQSGTWTVQQGSAPWSVSQSGTWNVGLSTGTNSIGDVRSITTSVAPGTGATHLGKAEDAGHASGDTGVMSLAVRNDTRGTLADTDLDYAPLQLNSSGDLRVDGSAIAQPVTDNGGSLTVDGSVSISGSVTVTGTVAATQSGSWTVTANAGSGTLGVAQTNLSTADYDTGAGTVTESMMGIALPASGGPVAGGTATNPIRIDPTGTTAQPVTDGGGSLTVDGTVAVSGTVTVTGVAAHGASISGNPLRTGGRAVNAEVTAVTNGQTADFVTDLVGKLIVLPFANPENLLSGSTGDIVDTTSTQVIAAQAASVRIYLTGLLVQNSHASVSTWVNIKDGSTTIHTVYAASGGGGARLEFPTPLKGTAATALNAVCETTGANVRVSASGYKGV